MGSPSASSLSVLVIRDGWGENPHPEHDAFNAVRLARTPVNDRLMQEFPWTYVRTSGEDVGLPHGTMGNSEVGHQNIGAGRVVAQESLLMTRACAAGLQTNPAMRSSLGRCVGGGPGGGPRLHLMGINSDAGVHGVLEHLFAILRAAKVMGVPRERVFVHLFTDGRDTGPFTGKAFAERVARTCEEIGVGRVASIVGRYFAMDRDHRWERVRAAFNLLTGRSEVPRFADAGAAVQEYYDRPIAENQRGDEFVTPRVIGEPAPIAPGDSVIFYNYRGDRPRELSAAFCFPDGEWAKVKPSPDSGVAGFDRGKKLDTHYTIMTEYWEKLTPHVQGVAFPRAPKMRGILGEAVAEAGRTQFRCAETEKYPHVTFFFNDYRDDPFEGERRENPQSPKVSTYDLKAEMAAYEVRDAVLRRIAAVDREAMLVVNFANADMVGHTGNLQAAVRACEAVDSCVGSIVDATLGAGGSLIVTADHGNAEQMWDPETKAPHTAHTVYDVPLIVVGARWRGRTLRGDRDRAGWFREEVRAGRGRLADIAPTLFELMGLVAPAEMSGLSLLVPASD